MEVNSFRFITLLWKLTLKKIGLVLSKQRNRKLLKINNRANDAILKQVKKSGTVEYRKVTVGKD